MTNLELWIIKKRKGVNGSLSVTVAEKNPKNKDSQSDGED